MKESIHIILDEHRSLSSVLHALKQLARMARDPRVQPRFAVFHAMLRYIDEYPEVMHHPKEDHYLFKRLAAVAPEARPLIARLEAEHREGARLARELDRALVRFEDRWPLGAEEFMAVVEAYAQFEWNHMRVEEQELLPIAERTFKPEDWAFVDAGFAPNFDPFRDMKKRDYRALFTRLVGLAPAPVGLGQPWKQRAGR